MQTCAVLCSWVCRHQAFCPGFDHLNPSTLNLLLCPPPPGHHSPRIQAHNGSGKTTCFTLGMLARVDPGVQAPQALCVCPTRELVVQNQMVLERMGKFTGARAGGRVQGHGQVVGGLLVQLAVEGWHWEGGVECCSAWAS